jgi:hypothetical protein
MTLNKVENKAETFKNKDGNESDDIITTDCVVNSYNE